MKWGIFGTGETCMYPAVTVCLPSMKYHARPWNQVLSRTDTQPPSQCSESYLSRWCFALSPKLHPSFSFFSWLVYKVMVFFMGFSFIWFLLILALESLHQTWYPSCQSPSSPTTSSSFCFLVTCILLSYFSESLHLSLAHPKSPLRLPFSTDDPFYDLCQHTHISSESKTHTWEKVCSTCLSKLGLLW